MTIESVSAPRASRIRTKTNVPVQLIMADGSQLLGSVFIGLDERVQDRLNDPKPFFSFRLENQDIFLINKTSVTICKPLDVAK